MKFFIALVVFSLISGTAAACYTDREVEAEQGLRIHSELMVIGLTCAKAPGGAGLYRKYREFTQKNSYLLNAYEENLISYFQNKNARTAEKKFHALRTNLANEISQHAISMSTLTFCQQYGSHIDQALQMDQNKLRRWALYARKDQPLSEPRCVSG